jgi:hypothetical protein
MLIPLKMKEIEKLLNLKITGKKQLQVKNYE